MYQFHAILAEQAEESGLNKKINFTHFCFLTLTLSEGMRKMSNPDSLGVKSFLILPGQFSQFCASHFSSV